MPQLERAASTCVSQLVHRLLDQLFPSGYDVEEGISRMRAWLEPVELKSGKRHFLYVRLDWSVATGRERRGDRYRLKLSHPVGFSVNESSGPLPSGLESIPFQVTLEPVTEGAERKEMEVILGLPAIHFLLGAVDSTRIESDPLEKTEVLGLAIPPSISGRDIVSDRSTGRALDAVVNLHAFRRCVEEEVMRETSP